MELMVDTYVGMAAHGEGVFSGKDYYTKVQKCLL
jgi:S-adenosylmethionine synthetase